MIKKLFNQKKTQNKRGSMLTLVMVILVMALILITSAITITNSTRSRYIDFTLTNQARTTATAVAESFATAIQTQEILDTELEAMAAGDVQVSVSGGSIPGLTGASETETTVKFSQGSGYIYMDVSTTVGKKDNGTNATENVRVYFKHKAPPAQVKLFSHMMEVGDDASFSSFDVGEGTVPPGGSNTVFIHNGGDLTKNGGNDMFSDVIATGRIKLGNGGNVRGYILFAGPNAGLAAGATGSPKFNQMYFIAPTGSGSVTPNASGIANIDINPWTATGVNVYTKNFDVNTNLRTSPINYYDAGGTTVNTTNNANINASYNANLSNSAMQAEAQTMLSKAIEALKDENKFPTAAQAATNFMLNVSTELESRSISGSGEHTLEPGVYSLTDGTQLNGKYYCDLNSGAYIFNVSGNVTIPGGVFYFENGDPNDDSNWARFILAENATLKIGGYDAGSNPIGIVSTTHGGLSRPTTAGEADRGTKPTCYIFGLTGSKFIVSNGKHMCDAYVGLYGTGSRITILSNNYLYGRFAATNFDSDNANHTKFPYCPGPHDDPTVKPKVPKTSDYEVVRFRYFYGSAPTA